MFMCADDSATSIYKYVPNLSPRFIVLCILLASPQRVKETPTKNSVIIAARSLISEDVRCKDFPLSGSTIKGGRSLQAHQTQSFDLRQPNLPSLSIMRTVSTFPLLLACPRHLTLTCFTLTHLQFLSPAFLKLFSSVHSPAHGCRGPGGADCGEGHARTIP